MYTPDTAQSCFHPRLRSIKLVFCDDPEHASKIRCNIKGRPMSSEFVIDMSKKNDGVDYLQFKISYANNVTVRD